MNQTHHAFIPGEAIVLAVDKGPKCQCCNESIAFAEELYTPFPFPHKRCCYECRKTRTGILKFPFLLLALVGAGWFVLSQIHPLFR